MLTSIHKNRHEYDQIIITNLEEFIYRMNRYNIEYAVSLSLCDKDFDLSKIRSHKRKTDKLIILENNLICIALDAVNTETAIKATSNLQTDFQTQCFGHKLYTCVVNSCDHESEFELINYLFYILEYAISNNMDGLIIDQTQIVFNDN
ncbi:MAG: hypothetical protein L3J10_10425 [Sulfurimonas sp.]|nr:hypothetical protein [Sulfurimonas sp.]